MGPRPSNKYPWHKFSRSNMQKRRKINFTRSRQETINSSEGGPNIDPAHPGGARTIEIRLHTSPPIPRHRRNSFLPSSYRRQYANAMETRVRATPPATSARAQPSQHSSPPLRAYAAPVKHRSVTWAVVAFSWPHHRHASHRGNRTCRSARHHVTSSALDRPFLFLRPRPAMALFPAALALILKE